MARRSRSALYLAVVVVLSTVIWGCGSESTSPSDPRIDQITVHLADFPPNDVILPGETHQMIVTAFDTAGNIIPVGHVGWSSSDTSIASIDDDGLMTARKVGFADIIARIGNRMERGEVIVQPHLAVLELNIETLSVVPGDSVRVWASLEDSAGSRLPTRPITWTVSDPAIARTSSAGHVDSVIVLPRSAGDFVLYGAREGLKDSVVFHAVPTTYKQVSAGGTHACGLTNAGDIYCWGSNRYGELGRGSLYALFRNYPVPAPVSDSGSLGFTLVEAGLGYTCALDSAGKAYCWGDNTYGQLGTGDKQARTSPAAVAGGFAFDTLVAGEVSTCGISLSGVAFCWGTNTAGQMGTGTTVDLTPVPVQGNVQFISLTTARTTIQYSTWHTCGLDAGGVAYCWGRNFSGQLGDGTRATIDPNDAPWGHLTPNPVSGSLTYSMITAGSEHTCAVTTASERVCWGSNNGNALGIPGPDQLTPRIADDSLQWTILHAGKHKGCGIVSGGDAYCWGSNESGGLARLDGGTSEPTPIQVAAPHKFTQLSTGATMTCGLNTAGLTICWGNERFAAEIVPGQM